MTKAFFVFISALLVSGTFSSLVYAAPAHIIIMRHGEKNNDDEPNLSERGYARAEALAQVFTSARFLEVYGMPKAIYAASSGTNHSRRSIETLTPTAQALGIILNDSYNRKKPEDLMRDILNDSNLDGQTVLIAWNREGMEDMLKPFGKSFNKKWPAQVFDRFWVLDAKPDGSWNFFDVPQRLLHGDSVH